MSLKNIVKLIAGATIALSAVTAHAGDDDYRKGCKLSTLKGTYSFSNVVVHGGDIPAAFSAGFIYFDGKGNATVQTTDNDGGGAGAAPHLTTVAALTTNSEGVTQTETETGACVYNLQATLAVSAANCAYPVNLNLFVDAEGKDLNAISTGAYPSLITAFGAHRFSEKNILVKDAAPVVTPDTTPGCLNPSSS